MAGTRFGRSVRFRKTCHSVSAQAWQVGGAMAVSLAAYALPDRAVDGTVAQAVLHWDSVAPRIRAIAPSGGDGLPDRYWKDLMGKMRQWKAVAESGVIGPEPIV